MMSFTAIILFCATVSAVASTCVPRLELERIQQEFGDGKIRVVCPNTTRSCRKINIADGFCDYYNNNCVCDWDGGDCCKGNQQQNASKYCSACNDRLCRCRDPKSSQTPKLFEGESLTFDCPDGFHKNPIKSTCTSDGFVHVRATTVAGETEVQLGCVPVSPDASCFTFANSTKLGCSLQEIDHDACVKMISHMLHLSHIGKSYQDILQSDISTVDFTIQYLLYLNFLSLSLELLVLAGLVLSCFPKHAKASGKEKKWISFANIGVNISTVIITIIVITPAQRVVDSGCINSREDAYKGLGRVTGTLVNAIVVGCIELVTNAVKLIVLLFKRKKKKKNKRPGVSDVLLSVLEVALGTVKQILVFMAQPGLEQVFVDALTFEDTSWCYYCMHGADSGIKADYLDKRDATKISSFVLVLVFAILFLVWMRVKPTKVGIKR